MFTAETGNTHAAMLTAERPRTTKKRPAPLTVRMPVILTAHLRMIARRRGMTLNKLIVDLLEEHALTDLNVKPPTT